MSFRNRERERERERERKLLGREYFFKNIILLSKNFCTFKFTFLFLELNFICLIHYFFRQKLLTPVYDDCVCSAN